MYVEFSTYHSINIFSTGTKVWDLMQEGGGNRLQGFSRPLVKPVDGTAVHKRGELSQACAEDFSNRAERKTCRNEMLQLAADTRIKYLSCFPRAILNCYKYHSRGIYPRNKEGGK